jgi:hypothetical protein
MNSLKRLFIGISDSSTKLPRSIAGIYDASPELPSLIARYNIGIKRVFRRTFGSIYFKFRYLNASNISLNGQVYKNSFDYYTNNVSPLYFSESKMQELFELADKAKFLSASLIQIDIQEVNTVDNHKEGYQYTVRIIYLGSIC